MCLGIPPRPRGEIEFDVSFEINVEGILNVTAVQIDGDLRHELQIDSKKGHLSEAEIKTMIENAEKHREADEQRKRAIRAMIQLQQYVTDLKDSLMQLELEEDDEDFCRKQYDDVMDWLQEKENQVTPEACEAKEKELNKNVLPVLKKYQ